MGQYCSSILSNVPFESEEQILSIVKSLSIMYGCCIKPRGRHSNRKLVYAENGLRWYPNTQNDVPWRLAERVSFYKVKKY